MAFPVCTEQSLTSLINCLQCVDKDKLIAFQVRLLLQITGLEISPLAVQEAMCVKCHSDIDLLRMETVLWAELAVALRARADWNVPDLVDETKCYNCTDPHVLRAARMLLLCTYLKGIADAPA